MQGLVVVVGVVPHKHPVVVVVELLVVVPPALVVVLEVVLVVVQPFCVRFQQEVVPNTHVH